MRTVSVACVILLTLVIVTAALSSDSINVMTTSPDGKTNLRSDGHQVYITRNGREVVLAEPNVMAFTFMDNTTALMNRTDYGVLIINVVTAQVFWLGYNPPDSYCDPCNIGGGGTDVYTATQLPVTPSPVSTKGYR